MFFLNNADKKPIKAGRGPHNRLGYALQLTTVRYLGRFLANPLDGVPTEVLDCLHAMAERVLRGRKGQLLQPTTTAWKISSARWASS